VVRLKVAVLKKLCVCVCVCEVREEIDLTDHQIMPRDTYCFVKKSCVLETQVQSLFSEIYGFTFISEPT